MSFSLAHVLLPIWQPLGPRPPPSRPGFIPEEPRGPGCQGITAQRRQEQRPPRNTEISAPIYFCFNFTFNYVLGKEVLHSHGLEFKWVVGKLSDRNLAGCDEIPWAHKMGTGVSER